MAGAVLGALLLLLLLILTRHVCLGSRRAVLTQARELALLRAPQVFPPAERREKPKEQPRPAVELDLSLDEDEEKEDEEKEGESGAQESGETSLRDYASDSSASSSSTLDLELRVPVQAYFRNAAEDGRSIKHRQVVDGAVVVDVDSDLDSANGSLYDVSGSEVEGESESEGERMDV